MTNNEKPVFWVGSSKKDLLGLPVKVRKFFGHALAFAQSGSQHDAAKVMKGFGSAGVLEVVEVDEGGTYRAVYTVRFVEAVFVLHCFQKKASAALRPQKRIWKLSAAALRPLKNLCRRYENDGLCHRRCRN